MTRDSLTIEFAMARRQVRVSFEGIVRADALRGVYRQDGYAGQVIGVRGDGPVRLPNVLE